MLLDISLASTPQQQLLATGVDIPAYMDGVHVTLPECTPNAFANMPYTREQLRDMGVTDNVLKTVALPPPGNASSEAVFALLAGVVVSV